VLRDIFSYGRQQVKKELGAQKHATLAEIKPLGPELALIYELLKARAKVSTTSMASSLKTFVTFEAIRQIRKGVLEKEALRNGLEGLSDKELKRTASHSISEAFNYGRSEQASRQKEEIGRVQYSAIMDTATCENCEPLDGEVWDYDDPDTDKYAGGNPDCLGGGQCRCVLVFISKQEIRGR